ncbi:MAG: BTAD domain-containing putative transcriptional regulator, partial [Gordonia sp. (in: high G+C Gram-positive bacteria)]
MDSRPRIALLGPITVDGAMVTSGRARSLLVALALAHPRPVSAERLIGVAWPDRRPQHPAGALHTQISRLRRILGPDAITGAAAGYALSGPGPVSDLAVAEAAARSDSRPDSPGETLRLWRGDPGTDLSAGPLRDELTSRAEDAYWAVREQDWHDQLARDPSALVTELAAVRAGRPLDEHLAALHMRAAIADGDPNTALRIHAELARGLADALGADPGVEVAAAHNAALTYSPLPHAPAPPADAYVTSPGLIAGFGAALTHAPIVTVVGPAGIGKTRLVTEYLAAQRRPNVFVDLSGARRPSDLNAAIAIAAARGVLPDRFDGGLHTPDAGTALAQLAPADGIIVLDGGEALLGAVVDLVDEIRSRRTDVTVVVTSRVRVTLAGAQLVDVEPLAPPAAADLFVRRARMVRADARLDPVLVDDLCRRLDGSPLALELAAAQLRHLTLPDLLAGLAAGDGRFADVVAAGWELLPATAHRALEVLAQFGGEVRLDDAVRFSGVTTAGLAALCEHSMAMIVDDPDGRTRYRITGTVRDFVLARIAAEPGRAAVLRTEVTCWALDFVDDVVAELTAGRIPDTVVRLDEYTDVVLDALATAVDRSESALAREDPAPRQVRRLLPILVWRIVRTGGHPHAARYARAALVMPTGPAPAGRGEILGLACATAFLTLLRRPRDAARARSALRRAAAGPAPLVAPHHARVGSVPGAVDGLLVGLLTAPPATVAGTLARAARSADPLAAAVAEIIRSDIAEFRAAPAASRRFALHALTAAARAGNPCLLAAARQRLGRGHLLLGDRTGAAAHFARSADEFAGIGFAEESCRVRVHQAVALGTDAPGPAAELLGACLRETGDSRRPFVATAYAALAQLRVRSDPLGARRAAGTAVEIIGPPLDEYAAYLHGLYVVILHRTGATV